MWLRRSSPSKSSWRVGSTIGPRSRAAASYCARLVRTGRVTRAATRTSTCSSSKRPFAGVVDRRHATDAPHEQDRPCRFQPRVGVQHAGRESFPRGAYDCVRVVHVILDTRWMEQRQSELTFVHIGGGHPRQSGQASTGHASRTFRVRCDPSRSPINAGHHVPAPGLVSRKKIFVFHKAALWWSRGAQRATWGQGSGKIGDHRPGCKAGVSPEGGNVVFTAARS